MGLGVDARIFLAAIAFRLFSSLVAFLAIVTLPPFENQHFTVLGAPNAFWDGFARYDSGWYHGIASKGYVYGEGGRNSLAFFPLYPLLMRAGGSLLGGRPEDYYFAGIVVSWLAFAGAMVMLYRLARLDLDEHGALRAVMHAALFPFAFFFGLVYSESLFFLGLVTAAYAFRTKQWLLGAAAGAAMTATRSTAVMVLPGLAWIAWRAARPSPSGSGPPSRGGFGEASASLPRDRLHALLAVGACLAGVAAYSLYNVMVSGSPFAWYTAITYWNYEPGRNPLAIAVAIVQALLTRPLSYLSERMAPYDTLNMLAALGTLCLVPRVWRRFGFGYALIVLAGMLLPLSSGSPVGLGRYASVQFPMALALGSFQGPAAHRILLTVFAVAYVICLALFATVHPLF